MKLTRCPSCDLEETDHHDQFDCIAALKRALGAAVAPIKDSKNLTEDQAAAEVERRVYDALGIFEELEIAGRIIGNGHHARQKLASAAAQDLRSRWFLREFQKEE